jgi:hypothetical protein
MAIATVAALAITAIKEAPEIIKATKELVKHGSEFATKIKDASDPLRADAITGNEVLKLAETYKTTEHTKIERGEIGEALFKSEQESRGVAGYAEQVPYSDIATKTTRRLDASFDRPRGSTFQEYVPGTDGKSSYLAERTVSVPERCNTEIKNYNPESVNLQSSDGAHLLKQLEAMKTGLPGKTELALPRDTVLAPEAQDALRKIHDLGVRIVTFTSRSAQAGAGLG